MTFCKLLKYSFGVLIRFLFGCLESSYALVLFYRQYWTEWIFSQIVFLKPNQNHFLVIFLHMRPTQENSSFAFNNICIVLFSSPFSESLGIFYNSSSSLASILGLVYYLSEYTSYFISMYHQLLFANHL